MRVVAGSLRGRAIRAPKGDATRPTSDRVRESLFAVLGDLTGVRVLDLYAGSGALAIEAISRGAASAVCVEHDRSAAAIVRANLSALGLEDRVILLSRRVRESAPEIAARGPFELVLVDPPYADVSSGALLREIGPLLAKTPSPLTPSGLLVLEHATRDEPPSLPLLALEETRRWGDTSATFYRSPGSDGAQNEAR